MKNILLLILVAFTFMPVCGQYPKTLDYTDYMQIKKEWDFRGYTLQSEKSFLYLYYSRGNVSIIYAYYDELPDTLTKHEKNLFLEHTEVISNANRKVYVMHYGDLPSNDRIASTRFFRAKKLLSETQRNFVLPQNPQSMDIKQVTDYIKNNKVIFYTSEGIISLLNYDELMNTMGIDVNKFKQNPAIYCKIILENKEKIYEIFKQYCTKALTLFPTEAHLALATIIKRKQSPLFTDNIDLLHEQTGLKVGRFWTEFEKVSLEPLKNFDAVVCIGLDKDSYAFLTWYKQENPNGKIISIHTQKPNYLNDEDSFIEGDIQEIMPKIADAFL